MKECVNCPGATDHDTAYCPVMRAVPYGLLVRIVDGFENALAIDVEDMAEARAILEQPQADFVPAPPTVEYVGKSCGHGHVTARPDGIKARCGGPALCKVCQAEQKALRGFCDCNQGRLPCTCMTTKAAGTAGKARDA